MQHIGEIYAIVVAVLWTATALLSEAGVKRLGVLRMNIIRMFLALIFLSLTLYFTTGRPLPIYADTTTWFWLSISGFVGYVFGDICLFRSYVVIGSRFGQLFMTLSPLAAAFSCWLLLGEVPTLQALFGIFITIVGIAMSILKRADSENSSHFKLPIKGIFYGIGAGLGQGIGLTLSKIGMMRYSDVVPPELTNVRAVIPFSATFIRAIFGLAGFLVLLSINKGWGGLRDGLSDRRGLMFAILASVFGPFIGVALSLKSVQLADAGVAATLMALTPVIIILPSWLINRQKITKLEIVGAIVSVVGVALFFI